MSVEAVTYDQAKQVTLTFYRQVRDRTPLPLRDMPRKVIANQPLSVNSIIANIESNTNVGIWIVGEYAASLGVIIV